MINETNFKQVLFDYAYEKYGERFREFHDTFYDEFPYKYEGLSEDLYIKNFIDWLMVEKVLPDTGKTIVEEFVSEHPDLDEEMKQNLLQMGDVVSSTFVVLSKKHQYLKIKDQNTHKIYNVELTSDTYADVNSLLTGRIHPFGDSYRFLGIFLIQNHPFIMDVDVVMEHFNSGNIKDAEEMVLSPKSRLTAIINKYPFQWVDGICEKLSLDIKKKKNEKAKMIDSKVKSDLSQIVNSLSKKSKEALKLVLNNDGYIKYNGLKKYDDEITFWWKDEPPTSTIGILRLNALLTVGKMPMGGRMYKVALIPADIRDELMEVL
jgi:hypothetical protein